MKEGRKGRLEGEAGRLQPVPSSMTSAVIQGWKTRARIDMDEGKFFESAAR